MQKICVSMSYNESLYKIRTKNPRSQHFAPAIPKYKMSMKLFVRVELVMQIDTWNLEGYLPELYKSKGIKQTTCITLRHQQSYQRDSVIKSFTAY